MVYTSHPITVDSVSLDSVAWNVDSKVRAWPGSRAADVVISGIDGINASVNDDLEPSTWTLTMWLMGTDLTGVIPGGSTAMSECRKNLDALSFLFLGKRHALLDVQEVVHIDGTIRQAWCKVTDVIAPTITPGGLGRFTVVLSVPDGMTQDPTTQDWTQATLTSGNSYEVTTLAGSSAPINDAILLVTGPVTNPVLSDTTSSAFVQLNAALSASQQWRINCATWATRYSTGLTLGSADTTGTNGDAITRSGGGNARYLRLTPALVTGVRRVRIILSGTGFTTATAISVRARRKFLQ